MSSQLLSNTTNKGENGFDFNKWIIDNQLTQLRQVFIDHNATTSERLTLLSPEIQKVMTDQRILGTPQCIPTVMKALHNIDNYMITRALSQEEQSVINSIKASLESLDETEIEFNKLKQEYLFNQIQTTKICHAIITKINEAFDILIGALNKRKKELLDKVNNIESKANRSNNDDEKETDITSLCHDDIKSLRMFLKDKEKKYNDLLIENKGELDTKEFNEKIAALKANMNKIKQKIMANHDVKHDIDCMIDNANNTDFTDFNKATDFISRLDRIIDKNTSNHSAVYVEQYQHPQYYKCGANDKGSMMICHNNQNKSRNDEFFRDEYAAIYTKPDCQRYEGAPNVDVQTYHSSDIRKLTTKNSIGVSLTGFGSITKAKYEQIVKDLNGVVLTTANFDADDGKINFKYIVANKLVRSEKIIVGMIQKKIIVKTEYLDACKKASKWLPSEPYCWMNDPALISYIPSDGTEIQTHDSKLHCLVDLVQAIRVWQEKDIKTSCFYGKNIFIWHPGDRVKTYYKILRSNGANVYSIRYQDISMSIEECIVECREISANIDEVYLANEDEVKQAAKAYCKSIGKRFDKTLIMSVFKGLMKKLTIIAAYWTAKKKLMCYDSDYVLDWVLEGAVFKNSDLSKDDYKFSMD